MLLDGASSAKAATNIRARDAGVDRLNSGTRGSRSVAASSTPAQSCSHGKRSRSGLNASNSKPTRSTLTPRCHTPKMWRDIRRRSTAKLYAPRRWHTADTAWFSVIAKTSAGDAGWVGSAPDVGAPAGWVMDKFDFVLILLPSCSRWRWGTCSRASAFASRARTRAAFHRLLTFARSERALLQTFVDWLALWDLRSPSEWDLLTIAVIFTYPIVIYFHCASRQCLSRRCEQPCLTWKLSSIGKTRWLYYMACSRCCRLIFMGGSWVLFWCRTSAPELFDTATMPQQFCRSSAVLLALCPRVERNGFAGVAISAADRLVHPSSPALIR